MHPSPAGSPTSATTPRRRPRAASALIVLLAFAGPPRSAPAGPIRAGLQAQRARAFAAEVVWPGSPWDRYFARALREHRLNVRGPNALRVLSADADGRLPDCAFVDYLQWRRSLNPARFDRIHPRLGPLLDRDVIVRVRTPPETGGGTTTPPTPPVTVNPEVPEPPSASVALLLLAAGGLWACRRPRPAQPTSSQAPAR